MGVSGGRDSTSTLFLLLNLALSRMDECAWALYWLCRILIAARSRSGIFLLAKKNIESKKKIGGASKEKYDDHRHYKIQTNN